MRLTLVFTVLLGIAAGSGWAQVPMDSLTVADGLSQGFPTSIIQDSRGYLWIGTFDGLNRYDGYKVKRYGIKPFDPWSLQTALITQVYEDRRGLLWVGTHQGLYLFDPLTERFYLTGAGQSTFPTLRIQKMVGDQWGRMFVMAEGDSLGKAIFRLDFPADFVAGIRAEKFGVEAVKVQPVESNFLDRDRWAFFDCIGDTMLLTCGADGRAYRYMDSAGGFQPFEPERIPIGPTVISDILWGDRWGYLFRWGAAEKQYAPPGDWLRTIRIDRDKTGIWLFDCGPLVLKKSDHPFDFNALRGKEDLLKDPAFQKEFTQLVPFDPRWNNKVLSDHTGTIWLGTAGWGLRKINTRKLLFEKLFRGQSISSLRELPDGRIWVHFFTDHSVVVNPATGLAEAPPLPDQKWIVDVKIDRSGNCWLIVPAPGQHNTKDVLCYEKSTNRLKKIETNISSFAGIPERILEDSDGNIWIAAHQGLLLRCRPGVDTPEHLSYTGISPNNPVSSLRSTGLLQDAVGRIWLTTNVGIARIDNPADARPRFVYYRHQPKDSHSLSVDWITCICPDPGDAQTIWFGSKGGGINRLDLRTQQFSYISESPEGLPDNVVYGIIPDDAGNFWCSTNRGLCRFNPQSNTFESFKKSDGLINDEFNTHAFLRGRDGRLWFGGVSGLDYFYPAAIHSDAIPAQLAITGIKVRGIDHLPDTESELELPYAENNVLFEFALLDFTNPATNRFRHRLKGLENDWVYDGTQHQVNYAALPPGTYLFEVQGATAYGAWSEKSLQFKLVIRTPFYRSCLAFLLYFTLITLLVWGAMRYRIKMIRLQASESSSRLESERIRQFEAVKNQFFANLAHELRTPLTVILGLAKRLDREDITRETTEAHARDITEQGSVLLRLTDQILDLAKLESGHFKLQWANDDIVGFIRRNCAQLAHLAESKGILLREESSVNELWMDFDHLQLKKILNNLISNAVRHSAAGSTIRVTLSAEAAGRLCKLKVQDEGEGIAPEDLPHIFERFYQGKHSRSTNGASGLGLTLSRDLARLMGGEIVVESTLGAGSTFVVMLPIRKEAPKAVWVENDDIQVPQAVKGRQENALASDLPLLLVIEDNDAVTSYLQLCLQNHYRLVCVADGDAGIAAAFEHIPDLMLTDVALPGKNGFDVVSVIKEDPRTSHIPIVMLSAKVEPKDRMEGSRRGANAYLTKPFAEEELLYVLANLLQLQRNMRQRYASFASEGRLEPEPDMLCKQEIRMEDAFMGRLYEVFEAHFADETFNLDRLCKLLNMSSSQLDRKLKALTDQSPMQLLRKFRLNKAQALLQSEPGLSIKNVCFRTGFKSPSHFSRAFAEEFGKPPSEV